jgi:hypothetical protein
MSLRTVALLTVGACLTSPMASADDTGDDPVAPKPDETLAPLAAHIEHGMNAWLQGEEHPFAPWILTPAPEGLRSEVRGAGVTTFGDTGFEFEPHATGLHQQAGVVRTTVAMQNETQLRSSACADVAVVNPEGWVGTPLLEQEERSVKKLKENPTEICAALWKAEARATHLKMDDYGSFAYDAEGRGLGIVRGEFGRRDDGTLFINLRSGFEPFDTEVSGERSTPKATWTSLLAAVAARDLEAYAACFAPERREREGAVDRLRADPAMWDKLAGVLRGPQEFTVTRQEQGQARCSVEAPEADGGGIGGLSMRLIDGHWLVWSW